MTLIRYIIPLLIGLSVTPCFGFFHLEPGIGYNRGHYQTNKAQGIGLSTKAGFKFGSSFIVADVGYNDLQLGSTPTSNLTDVGVSFGYDAKAWRVWYSHLVSATLAIEASGETTTYTGGGMKLGLSAALSRSAYLNLEMRFIDFNEQSGASGSAPIRHFMDSGFISISWPLF